jgi:hypothetical protein
MLVLVDLGKLYGTNLQQCSGDNILSHKGLSEIYIFAVNKPEEKYIFHLVIGE